MPRSTRTNGKLSSEKGKVFERTIATILRKEFPCATVVRSRQSDRPYDSDVYIESGTCDTLRQLWFECNSAAAPNPYKKLEQAERDCEQYLERTGNARYPLVVWRQRSKRKIWVTLRHDCLIELNGVTAVPSGFINPPVTIQLEEFLQLLYCIEKSETDKAE